MKPINLLRLLFMALLLLFLDGCGSTRIKTSPRVELDTGASWGVASFANHTTVPFAGQRAQKLTAALLQGHGVAQVSLPPPPAKSLPLGQPGPLRNQELAWARERGIRYLVTGSVEEWRYKVGLEGEPAVSLTLELIDMSTGQRLWRGAASLSGRYWQSVGVLAQSALDDLIERLLVP